MEDRENSSVAINVIWALVVLLIAGGIFYVLWNGNLFKPQNKKVDVDISVPSR
jgi:hypothetical protein